MKTLLWLNKNLRTIDNETLWAALKTDNELVAIYIWDEDLMNKVQFGFHKMGRFRKQFLKECLDDLKVNLLLFDIPLIVLKGDTINELIQFVNDNKIGQVFVEIPAAIDEQKLQFKIHKILQKLNVNFFEIGHNYLFDETDLPYTIQEVPDVFTNFRKLIENNIIRTPILSEKRNFQINHLTNNEERLFSSTIAFLFKGGENQAWLRIKNYFWDKHHIRNYKQTRNGMLGTEYSSKLSAYLAFGCISARSVYQEILRFETEIERNESTYALYFELIWREFFYWKMKQMPNAYFMLNGLNKNIYNYQKNDYKLKAWINGNTGNDYIDANMRELNQTGFMSNRGRQNVASFFCHQLKLDWRIGSAYFEQQLVDYDVANNWCNWAYIAGVGNDPRPTRIFNIEKQAQQYDANKEYRAFWLNY
jgi:deoxyribodipyrimidine photo-lyase